MLPTILQLEQISRFATVTELLECCRGREVVPVEPRLVQVDGEQHVLLPGDEGYGGA